MRYYSGHHILINVRCFVIRFFFTLASSVVIVLVIFVKICGRTVAFFWICVGYCPFFCVGATRVKQRIRER